MSPSDWVGLVGGVTGIGSAIVSYAAYRRDQARLRIWLGYDYHVTAGKDADDLVRVTLAQMRAAGETPPHALYYRDPDITWMSIDIANVGRRPIKIEKVGFVVDAPSHPFHVLGDFQPRVLAEGENVTQNSDQNKEREHQVLAAFAHDAAKRMHYGGFVGGWRGFVCRVKALMGSRPFPH